MSVAYEKTKMIKFVFIKSVKLTEYFEKCF